MREVTTMFGIEFRPEMEYAQGKILEMKGKVRRY
jgi:hypothetical protein